MAGCSGAGDQPPQNGGSKDKCVLRRVAYDIGSGTTKVKVADIDRCRGVLLKLHFAEDAPMPYGDDVAGSMPGFSPQTMDEGVQVLRRFATQAAKFKPDESAAVATSAFRKADNGAVMADRIRRELDIPVSIITQLQEARIGFVAAVIMSGAEPKDAVVWDVGGRSMQISSLQDNGRMFIYRGKFASGQMRDYVIREVKGQPSTVRTPNPLSKAEAKRARTFAESYATEQVPPHLQKKLANQDTVVVGIGALKYYGDKPAKEDGAVCTRTVLDVDIGNLVGKSDDEIGGSYASTAVTNRLLLAGFMSALQIDVVQLADIDLTDGVFFENEYWPADGVAQGDIFFLERWGTRVESSPFFALGPSSVPHIVLQR